MRWQRRLYRHRGWLAVPPALFAIWTAEPRPALVVAGAILMSLGEALRLWAAAHLGKTARSRTPRATKLVTTGPYARTRHPLYTGNLLLVTGFATLCGGYWPWFPGAIAALVLALYRGHALAEERALAAAWPDLHATYVSRVPRWGWKLRPARVHGVDPGCPSLLRALRVEALTLHAEAWLLIAVWLRTRWGSGG